MIREEVNHPDWEFPFILYLPETEPKNCPVIVQLHGAGEVGDGHEELIRVETHGISKLIQKGEEYPCMIVMPQCPTESFWAAEIPNIYAFINRLVETYSVDSGRIYLTGLSMGGFGTWYAAMAAPERFAAIAPVCGGGMAWNAGVLTMPVWAFHGAEDTSVDVFHSDDMVAGMEKCKLDVRYSRYDGVGHDVWKKTYDEELLNWMLSHRRK